MPRLAFALLLLGVVSFPCSTVRACAAAPETNAKISSGTAPFKPLGDEQALPEPFRLAPHTFEYQLEPQNTRSAVMTVSKVTFPSPVVTPHENNNTVHCEYFSPTKPGKKPGVIVLHILGGDFDLARL